MKRADRIKLNFVRNWNLPGKERLSHLFKPSDALKENLNNGIIWLNNEDIAIYTNTDNYIEWTILTTGTYEGEINKLIRISLKTGGSALDIGANIGLQSIRMAQVAGVNGKVYAFEPLNYLQEKFKKNVTLNNISNITLMPFALSDKASEEDFSINENLWNQGEFSLNNHGNGNKTQHVSVKIADNIKEIQELASLDLIKIDVEGFEFQVLQGLKQTIQKFKPRLIFEYDHNHWAKAGQQIMDCYNFLQSFNYTLYQITPVGCELIKNPEQITSGNLFCIHH